MQIITGTTDFFLEKNTAVAIGKFDGVHIGHRKLLEEIRVCRPKGTAVCVFTFDPAPAVLFGRQDGAELTTREEKRLLFERLNVDILIEFPLTLQSAAMPPELFVKEILARRMNTRFVAAGRDLSFGAGGAGDAELLRELGPKLGFDVKIIDKVCLDGQEVSSTLVRSKVELGDMALVEKLMGMPYLVAGKVEEGRKLGRRLGVPTVNILPGKNKLLPPNGVYRSGVRCGMRSFDAVSNVGCKPTVAEGEAMGVESFLYDFDEEIYGKEIEVYLYEFRRPERRFESVEALKSQLQRDVEDGERRRRAF